MSVLCLMYQLTLSIPCLVDATLKCGSRLDDVRLNGTRFTDHAVFGFLRTVVGTERPPAELQDEIKIHFRPYFPERTGGSRRSFRFSVNMEMTRVHTMLEVLRVERCRAMQMAALPPGARASFVTISSIPELLERIRSETWASTCLHIVADPKFAPCLKTDRPVNLLTYQWSDPLPCGRLRPSGHLRTARSRP